MLSVPLYLCSSTGGNSQPAITSSVAVSGGYSSAVPAATEELEDDGGDGEFGDEFDVAATDEGDMPPNVLTSERVSPAPQPPKPEHHQLRQQQQPSTTSSTAASSDQQSIEQAAAFTLPGTHAMLQPPTSREEMEPPSTVAAIFAHVGSTV